MHPSSSTWRADVPRRLPDGRQPDPADARFALTEATRRVIAELASSSASDEAFEEARDLVARAADLLADREHARRYDRAEGSLIGPEDSFDYSPFVGALNPLAPPIRMRAVDDTTIVGDVVFGLAYEGPPGCVHGGFVAAGFDDVLGFAQSMSGTPGMTGRLEVSYRSPTPLHQPLRYRGWIDRIEGRKLFTVATLHHGDVLCAEATGLFIHKPDIFERLMRERAQPAG
jgi:acyl-coenzyme A thioesterase PaaI-like protein